MRRQHSFEFVKAGCISPTLTAQHSACVVIHSAPLPFGRHFGGTGANLAAGYNPKIGTQNKQEVKKEGLTKKLGVMR